MSSLPSDPRSSLPARPEFFYRVMPGVWAVIAAFALVQRVDPAVTMGAVIMSGLSVNAWRHRRFELAVATLLANTTARLTGERTLGA